MTISTTSHNFARVDCMWINFPHVKSKNVYQRHEKEFSWKSRENLLAIKKLIPGDFNNNLMNLNTVVSCHIFHDYFISESYISFIDTPTKVVRPSASHPHNVYVDFLDFFLHVFFKLVLVTIMLLFVGYLNG